MQLDLQLWYEYQKQSTAFWLKLSACWPFKQIPTHLREVIPDLHNLLQHSPFLLWRCHYHLQDLKSWPALFQQSCKTEIEISKALDNISKCITSTCFLASEALISHVGFQNEIFTATSLCLGHLYTLYFPHILFQIFILWPDVSKTFCTSFRLSKVCPLLPLRFYAPVIAEVHSTVAFRQTFWASEVTCLLSMVITLTCSFPT